MQRTHLFSKTTGLLASMMMLISFIGQAQDTQTFGTELFSTFEHIPRATIASAPVDTTIRDGAGAGGPTGPTGVLPAQGIYRTVDGTFNNLSFPEWGASDIPFRRGVPAAYGPPDMLNDLAGATRKSARAISNLLNKQNSSMPSQNQLSSFVFTWGQFLDHDIDLSGEGETEPAPIALPANEPTFTQPIRFTRSEVFPGTGITTPREQENIITSWMDASNVYGSERTRARWLRTFQNGKLKTSSGNLLPYNTIDGERYSPIDPTAPSMAATPGVTSSFFVAGDVRANEQPGLTTLHTLFVREHNRYCDELIASGLTNDEEIYQTARKWIGGLIQHISFTEFLPSMGIQLNPYSGYDPSTQPDINNIFANAAYRIGHTMVTDDLLLLDKDCNTIEANNSLVGNFFNNTLIQNFGIEPIFRGLSANVQQEIDLKVVDGLRDFLFQIPGVPPAGLDLASLNIQRGRDHGLPDFNSVRQQFLGQKVSYFSQITRDRNLQYRLKFAYHGDINNIDPWIGLLAEDHVPGTSVGPTMLAIIKDQFQRLRDGDYYYFENDPAIPSAVKQVIRNTTLSMVLARNTTFEAPKNVFKVEECESKEMGSACDKVTIAANGKKIRLSNISAPIIQIKVFTIQPHGGYTTAFHYTGRTNKQFETDRLPNGRHKVIFSLYDASWKQICGPIEQEITIGNGNENGNEDACDKVIIASANGGITIDNLTTPFKNIKVFKMNPYGGYANPAIYECVGACQPSIAIPNLASGKYIVLLSLFDGGWSPICKDKKYTVTVTGNHFTSLPATSRTVGAVDQKISEGFQLFPNPTSDRTLIDLSAYQGKRIQLAVTDYLGRIIYNEQLPNVKERFKEIHTADWNSGLYSVSVKEEAVGVVSKKLMIQHK